MAAALILTGGIGSGKSTVAALLAGWGAHVVDADQLAREVVAPGTAGLAEVTRSFGPDVIDAGGALNRTVLAEIVFDDPARLAVLEGIVHPLVERLAAARLADGAAAPMLVYEVPLPDRRAPFPTTVAAQAEPLVVVVDAPAEERHGRLRRRGLSDQQITARMASQPSREQWLAGADVVIDNSGNRDDLRNQVAALWARCTGAEAPVGGDG